MKEAYYSIQMDIHCVCILYVTVRTLVPQSVRVLSFRADVSSVVSGKLHS